MKKLGLALLAILVLLLVARGGVYLVAKHKWTAYETQWKVEVSGERTRSSSVRCPALHGPPIDENAALRYRSLIATITGDDTKHAAAVVKSVADWDAPIAPEALAVLDARRDVVAKLREAARCNRIDWQIPWETAQTPDLPDLAKTRTLAALLALEARECADRSDGTGAAARLTEELRMGLDLQQGCPLVTTLVGIAITKQALDALGELVTRSIPGAVRLGTLAGDLLKLEDAVPDPSTVYRGERLALRSFLSPSSGPEGIPVWEFIAFQIPDLDQLYRDADKAIALPDRAARKRALAALDARAQDFSRPFVATAWPNVARVPDLVDDNLARYRLVLAAITVEKKRAADGSYAPDQSGFAFPQDPYGTGELRYKASPSGNGYKLWSVWRDGKDDGGTPPAPGASGADAEKGDLVLGRKG
jgi:hypothetical protein